MKLAASPVRGEAASLVGSINGGLTGASRRVSYAGALHDGPEAR